MNKVYKKVDFSHGSTIVDYGCGKYDSNRKYVESLEKSIRWYGYDPYNRTDEENQSALSVMDKKAVDYIIVSNVLNVIQEEEEIVKIIDRVCNSLKSDSVLYIQIYEGNKSSVGEVTSKGYQRNEPTNNYIRFLDKDIFSVQKKDNILICRKS